MRRVFILLALTMFATCFYDMARSEEHSKDEKANSNRADNSDNRQSDQIVFPVRILENPPETEADKRSKQESEQLEKDDLVAQQSVAKSTVEMVWLTGLQFILALLGTIALVYSIALDRKAAHAAAEAAAQARSGRRA